MKKCRILFILTTLFFLTNINILAIDKDNSKIIQITPNVICDPELGCILSTTYADTKYTVTRYIQSSYSNALTGGCGQTIASAGCAVASQAVIASKFSGSSITPIDVNNTVDVTCEYWSIRFENGYPTLVALNAAHSSYVSITNKEAVIDIVAPHISNDHLAIIAGINSSTSHFVVVNGYRTKTTTFQYGTITSYIELYITDSGSNRTTLTQFMDDFPTVTMYHIYEKK